jgi:RNA recognition motif-containing protein
MNKNWPTLRFREKTQIQHGEYMKKKLFVGNLSWKVTEEILKPLFEAYGTVVSIKIIVDQYTGKSKGFGFVEMESADAAARSIDELNDKPLLERNLRVSLAQERSERPREGGSMGREGGGGGRDYRGSNNDRGGNDRGNRSFGQRPERNYNM